ncbi:MAG: SRPBCC family protein [Phototrophicales bacterium]|nr:SRPBCC family protein [Phototrophicales bacterium]
MSILEHSILIPTAVENVWQFVSNIENNALWLADCRSIAFLTSYKQGRGARWRHTNEGGRDYVIEIANWYERVGYRYTIVNGAPYATNAGIIRLQETPEGTIVQWTFEYTLTGFLSGVRNTMSVKRSIEGNIIDSLQTLYKQVGKSKGVVPFTPKSLMQDAPDAEARAQYKPRHPSLFTDKPADEFSAADLLTEPPFSDEDTKQRPAVTSDEIQTDVAFNATEARATLFEKPKDPDFLAGIDADTAMNVPKPTATQSSPILEKPTVEVSPLFTTTEKPTAEVPILAPTPENNPYELPKLNEPSALDTSQLSIFDIFGMQKPSETQQMKAVEQSAVEAYIPTPLSRIGTPPKPTAIVEMSFGRVGRKILLRRKMVKLRKPQ